MHRLIILLGVLIVLLSGCTVSVITPDYSLYSDNTFNETWLEGMWPTEAIHPEYDEPFNVFEFIMDDGEPKLFVYNLVISEGVAAYEIYEYDIELDSYKIFQNYFLVHRAELIGHRFIDDLATGEKVEIPVYITIFYSYVDKNTIILEAAFHTIEEDKSKGPVFDRAIFRLIRDNVAIPNL